MSRDTGGALRRTVQGHTSLSGAFLDPTPEQVEAALVVMLQSWLLDVLATTGAGPSRAAQIEKVKERARDTWMHGVRVSNLSVDKLTMLLQAVYFEHDRARGQ